MTHAIDQRLQAHNLVLPVLPATQPSNRPWTCAGEWLHLGGQLPYLQGQVLTGQVGADLDLESGQKAARLCALAVVAQLRDALSGDWSRLSQLVRIAVNVRAVPDFPELEDVANAASEQLTQILGERGQHARSVSVVLGLPGSAAVQIDAIAHILPKNYTIGLFP